MKRYLIWPLILALAPTALAEKAAPDVTLEGHKSPLLDLAFSPDGKRLASVDEDGKVKVWDVEARKELFTFKDVATNQNQVRFTPDGAVLACIGGNNDLASFDLKTGKARKPIAFEGVPGGPRGIDLSPDGKTLAAVGRGMLRLYDFPSGEQKAAIEVHPQYGVNAVAFSPDGKHLATCGTDKTATLVDLKSGKVLRTFPIGLNGVCLTFARDGKKLFVASTDRKLRAFDLAGDEETVFVEKGVPILTLAVSKDGKMLVLGGVARAPWIVSLPEGKLQEATLDGDDHVKAAAISPDNAWLAGGANGGPIYLWKTARREK